MGVWGVCREENICVERFTPSIFLYQELKIAKMRRISPVPVDNRIFTCGYPQVSSPPTLVLT